MSREEAKPAKHMLCFHGLVSQFLEVDMIPTAQLRRANRCGSGSPSPDLSS